MLAAELRFSTESDFGEQVDDFWLLAKSERWVQQNRASYNILAFRSLPLRYHVVIDRAFTGEELAGTMEGLLESSQSSEELQQSLMELLGASQHALEFINLVLRYRVPRRPRTPHRSPVLICSAFKVDILHAKLTELEAKEAELAAESGGVVQSEFVIRSKKEQELTKNLQKQVPLNDIPS